MQSLWAPARSLQTPMQWPWATARRHLPPVRRQSEPMPLSPSPPVLAHLLVEAQPSSAALVRSRSAIRTGLLGMAQAQLAMATARLATAHWPSATTILVSDKVRLRWATAIAPRGSGLSHRETRILQLGRRQWPRVWAPALSAMARLLLANRPWP